MDLFVYQNIKKEVCLINEITILSYFGRGFKLKIYECFINLFVLYSSEELFFIIKKAFVVLPINIHGKMKRLTSAPKYAHFRFKIVHQIDPKNRIRELIL